MYYTDLHQYNHSENNWVQIEQAGPETYSITVNTGSHRLSLFRNGLLIKSYPVAVGKPSTPTPKGAYKIINKT
jgi:hypothetical protein